ncbi:MAG TPA: substrate-binding domain-containing protein, partial [Acidimicrobiales bacterium]|nr:substrate-binding domain-containing protein [Acidimicrobiales bacterium]
AVSLSALAAAVNAAAAQPSFATYAKNYGSALTNPGALKGEKVMVMPGDSQLAACEEIAQAFSVLAKAEGQSPTIFQNDGETSQYITAFEDAIHEGYKSISIECDFNPASVAPVIAQAEKAGVKVIVYGATQQENIQAHVQGSTVDPYALDAQVAAEQAVLQSGGKPFQAIAITSNQAPATAIMQDALMKELSKICPACTVTDYDVEVPEWTADVGSTVTSALIKNPKVSVIFPDYAGMLSDVLAGIEAAHRTTSVRTYLAFGGGTPFIQLQAAPPGSKIIQSDIGGYPVWTGYLLYYQTARVLTGMTPIPYALAYGPDRVATPQNAAQILTTGGWGTDFVNGFRSLLGLSTLSGHALFEAATLNGTMTAKV